MEKTGQEFDDSQYLVNSEGTIYGVCKLVQLITSGVVNGDSFTRHDMETSHILLLEHEYTHAVLKLIQELYDNHPGINFFKDCVDLI